jgi:hypothetical protein
MASEVELEKKGTGDAAPSPDATQDDADDNPSIWVSADELDARDRDVQARRMA